jgi:preprotein translocase subunit SecG
MLTLFWIIGFAFVFLCFIMILLVLIQKGRGGGLSGAFGGGGGGNTAFGAKTGDVLTWATSIVFALFVLLAVILNRVADNIDASATVQPRQMPAGQPPAGMPASDQPIPGR